jgi:hypothetical protein
MNSATDENKEKGSAHKKLIRHEREEEMQLCISSRNMYTIYAVHMIKTMTT